MPPIILFVWGLGIASKGLAAYRIIRKGLFESLGLFLTFILISVARSGALLYFSQDPTRYKYIAADSMPLMLLAEGFAISSAFWLLTENFPRWRRAGTIVLVSLALLGTLAALLLRSVAVPADWRDGWAEAWQGALLLQRHGMTAMAVVLAGSRLLLTVVRSFPVSRLARRATDALMIDVALGLANSVLTMWFGRRYPLVAYAGPVLAGLINGLLWTFWLPVAAETAPPYIPSWARTEQEMDWKQYASDLLLRARDRLHLRDAQR